jgi:hypothetical protein
MGRIMAAKKRMATRLTDALQDTIASYGAIQKYHVRESYKTYRE